MSFLNHSNSFSRDFDLHSLDSQESEAGFLKFKLIETHQKLIRELQISKQIDEELELYKNKYQECLAELSRANQKLFAQNTKADKAALEKQKQIELALVEAQKKNDLLRVDLESMRNKMLVVMSSKKELEDLNTDLEKQTQKCQEKMNSLARELKQKESESQKLEAMKVKNEKLTNQRDKLEKELENRRVENDSWEKKCRETEESLEEEREKHSKMMSDLLSREKQCKEWKFKVDHISSQADQYKDELYHLNQKLKNDDKSTHFQEKLNKLNQDYQNLQSVLKTTEKDLENARKKPMEEATRKKNNFQQAKELVSKLQKEEHLKANQRYNSKSQQKSSGFTSSRSPNKLYKEEKEEYLSMIEEVGTMENQMLNCNLQKKKVLNQMDRIDETKIKTKEMISRRRRLEVELQSQDRRLEHIKAELKKMKVM